MQYIEEGNQPALGKLMTEAQEIFDKKVAPKSPVELKGTVLHATMRDPALQQWIYGCKGVGSQGDGTVQFLAKDAQAQAELVAYLQNQKHLTAYALTLSPQKAVRKAIIPVAGLGLRLYPATKCIKKDFMTVLDQDGLLKPAILILLEQLYRANIREICLVIGEGERQMYEALFEPCPDEILQKLPQQKRDYDAMLQKIGRCITYLYQKERCGFGHAVYQCRDFAQNEPVLLLLGDMLYQTANPLNCMEQMMQVFDKTGKPVVSMHPIALQDVVHYGILHGKWENREETIMQLDAFVEKPACDYAQDYLNNTRQNCSGQFYAVFGQYILTPDVFDALAEDVSKGRKIRGEIQLTPALDRVRSKSGMIGYLIDGEAFDIGLPDKYRETVSKYGVHNGEGA